MRYLSISKSFIHISATLISLVFQYKISLFFKGFFSFLIMYMCVSLKRVWVPDCISDSLELSYRQLWVKCGCWGAGKWTWFLCPLIHISSPKTSLCHYCLSCSLSIFTLQSTSSRMTSLTFRTESDDLPSWSCSSTTPPVACHAILWLTLCLIESKLLLKLRHWIWILFILAEYLLNEVP